MRDLPSNNITREFNRVAEVWAEATAELWVSGSRALSELSYDINESFFPAEERGRGQTSNPAPEEESPDPSEMYRRALFDIGSAAFRAADAGSELLRRALFRFFEQGRY